LKGVLSCFAGWNSKFIIGCKKMSYKECDAIIYSLIFQNINNMMPPQSISANKGNQQNINSTERGISLHVCRERRYTTPAASTDISCGYHTAVYSKSKIEISIIYCYKVS
jgi:hypothetical protein